MLKDRIDNIQRLANELVAESILLTKYKTKERESLSKYLSEVLYTKEEMKEIEKAFNSIYEENFLTKKEYQVARVAFLFGYNFGTRKNK